jgi:hypothetical protein
VRRVRDDGIQTPGSSELGFAAPIQYVDISRMQSYGDDIVR